MSNTESGNHDKHEAIANRFGRTTDPYAEFDAAFWEMQDEDGVDPFELFLEDRIYSQDYEPDTVTSYERRTDQWVDYVSDNYDRHPACPSTKHVLEYARWELDNKGNQPDTVERKLEHLARVFYYFAESASFPHGKDFNPFKDALGKIDLSADDPKDPRPISLRELRTHMQDEVTNIRDRAIIMCGFKLGLRASEVSNIKVAEVNVANEAVHSHYDDMGIAAPLEGRPNAVYIPHDRERNKSERPKVLPLDDELRRALRQWLLIRPDNGEPWLFLSKSSGLKIDHTNINDIWKKYFRPKFGSTDRFRGVSSHYGRHFFTTWFEQEKEWKPHLVDFMRGDKQGGGDDISSRRTAIESYVHTYYEDIEARYRREVFKFRV